MKKIIIFGGSGEIGSILYPALIKEYDVTIGDIVKPKYEVSKYQYIDISQYEQVKDILAQNYEVVINLVGMEEVVDIPNNKIFTEMLGKYLIGVYNILDNMAHFKIKKIVQTSTNHVTDFYEKNGYSLLNREINPSDYPKSKSVYASLKLAGESLCFNYHYAFDISCICLRIGTARKGINKNIEPLLRSSRTMIYDEDLIDLYKCAIKTEIDYGIYYGVSNNTNKPWDISNAINELKYKPQ